MSDLILGVLEGTLGAVIGSTSPLLALPLSVLCSSMKLLWKGAERIVAAAGGMRRASMGGQRDRSSVGKHDLLGARVKRSVEEVE